ncbi:hypothetical protein VOLCADRAFT_94391 [Volvox carteri f. nagariensis]|uniref:DUF7906 domain-containing protein n=1 Tax=Volvox carteri f. nagariensis TaxID=3068 RepID=D8U4N4_VOLCA|nr:uncharacterized protein VOLCADRAFT_94391 [Volvox carteri f. nagariensis]EFJ45219.1 hypothetical protein VOLCADRAFT_94391 [Volvox carteri f. nagariensis]|eukprot:XP_002953595.1 hypothetical protein VOLCADRAFT_94391 [Volvox carteri f. nagariensis]
MGVLPEVTITSTYYELRTAPADRDVLAHVPKVQRHLWEYHDGRSINEALQSFADITVDITVAIKLIGFEGEGINHIKIHDADFQRYLRGLHLDVQTTALEPELHNLVGARVWGDPGVWGRACVRGKWDLGGCVGRATPPALPGQQGVDSTDAKAGGRADVSNLCRTTRSEFRSCPGMLYASEQITGGAGFAWVDLGAAPHAYGPLRGGQGQIFPHSLPHASNYQPNVANLAILPDLAALAASAVQHLAWPPLQHDKLALPRPSGGNALRVQVVHIHDTLAIPPRSLRKDVIEVGGCEHNRNHNHNPNHYPARTKPYHHRHHAGLRHHGPTNVQKELERALQGSSFTVEVQESFLSFAMCDLCVNAYTSALRIRTQRKEGSTVLATTGQILDRLVLHQTLTQYADIILAYAGVHETQDVLPVFLFDLSMRDEALLLDGTLQAAGFPDMVVAVATRANTVHTRFSCGHTVRHVNPSEVTREVLGGILQSACNSRGGCLNQASTATTFQTKQTPKASARSPAIGSALLSTVHWPLTRHSILNTPITPGHPAAFGVPHTALRYHPASGTGWNYLWDLGATPFGPLSDMTSLSAAIGSTMRRNLAVVELDVQAGRIAALLQGLSRLSPKGNWKAAVPAKEARNRIHARLNVAAIKLELAALALSQGRNADALRLARLLSHDASALERTALRLESGLLSKLQCRGTTDWTVYRHHAASVGGGVFVTCAWIRARVMNFRMYGVSCVLCHVCDVTARSCVAGCSEQGHT